MGIPITIASLNECNIQNGLDYGHLEKSWKHGPSIWSGGNDSKSSGIGILCKGTHVDIISTEEIVPGRMLLLNVLFKAKILVTRLKPFIAKLIHPSQVCGVPGRSIAESLNLLRDLICWDAVITRAERKISFWGLRKLTMEGKILIVKSVIIPMLLYVAMVFPPSILYIKKITKMCFYFIWGSKMEKLRREVMYKSRENGGRDVPDFFKFFYIKYLSFCFKCFNTDSAFSSFLRYACGMVFKRWARVSLSSPVLLCPPKHYAVLERTIRLLKLQQIDPNILKEQKKLTVFSRKEEICERVSGFTEGRARKVWRNVFGKFLANSHKDLAWSVVHQCLPKREFQCRRGLVASARCVRCGNDESVLHTMWNCGFSQELY
ncbi:uncharacterized protein RB166_020537 [Leptodactylus fuscus]